MKKIFLLFMVFSAAAFTQQKMSLTVDQAVAIGLENSKALHSSQMRVQYADAKSSEISAQQYPSLKFGGSYTRLSEVPPFEIGPIPPILPTAVTVSPSLLNSYNMRVTVQQPLFTGFRLQSSVNAADYSAEASAQDYTKDKSDLVYNVKNAYWSLFKARQFEKFLGETVAQIQAHLTDVQNMFQQGLVTKNEVLKVQVQLSNAQLMHIDAKNTVQLARIGLNNTLGIVLDTEIDLATDIKHSPKEFQPLEVLIQTAMENRPDMKAMDLRVKAGEAGVTAAKGNWFPQLYLLGNYYYARPNQRIFPTKDEFRDTWDVSLSVSLDIWNWGTTIHQTSQARAQLEQARDGLAQLRDGVTFDVTQNYLNVRQQKEKVSVAEQGVAQAEENFRVTSEKFKAGLASNSDLLDAETALLQARTNHTQTIVDYELAEARLEKAVGNQ